MAVVRDIHLKPKHGIAPFVIRLALAVVSAIVLVNIILLFDKVFIPAEWYLIPRMSNVDKRECLQSLRKMMRERETFLSLQDGYVAKRVGDAIQLSIAPKKSPLELPPEILSLHPTQIMLWKDRAIVTPKLFHRSISILAFDDGVAQFGTKKIIDGLWFWEGRKQKGSGVHP